MTAPGTCFTLLRTIDPTSREGFGFESDWPSVEKARRAAARKARESMLIADEAEIKRRLAPLADLLPGVSVTVEGVRYTIKPTA